MTGLIRDLVRDAERTPEIPAFIAAEYIAARFDLTDSMLRLW